MNRLHFNRTWWRIFSFRFNNYTTEHLSFFSWQVQSEQRQQFTLLFFPLMASSIHYFMNSGSEGRVANFSIVLQRRRLTVINWLCYNFLWRSSLDVEEQWSRDIELIDCYYLLGNMVRQVISLQIQLWNYLEDINSDRFSGVSFMKSILYDFMNE